MGKVYLLTFVDQPPLPQWKTPLASRKTQNIRDGGLVIPSFGPLPAAQNFYVPSDAAGVAQDLAQAKLGTKVSSPHVRLTPRQLLPPPQKGGVNSFGASCQMV